MINSRFKVGDLVKVRNKTFTGSAVKGIVQNFFENSGVLYYTLRCSNGVLNEWPSDDVHSLEEDLVSDPETSCIYY